MVTRFMVLLVQLLREHEAIAFSYIETAGDFGDRFLFMLLSETGERIKNQPTPITPRSIAVLISK